MRELRDELPTEVNEILRELDRLLRMRLAPGGRDHKSPLGKLVQAAIGHHFEAVRYAAAGRFAEAKLEYLRRDVEYSRARYILLDLRRLEVRRPDLLRSFVRRFRRAKSSSAFYPLRFELKMASMLILSKIQFSTPDPPDFQITVPDVTLAMECGSLRVSPGKSGDLSYKVLQEINSKARKPYATPTTALAIDVTNLYHRGWVPAGAAGFELPQEVAEQLRAETKSKILRVLEATNFGSVLVYQTIFDTDARRIESNYIRIDHPHIAPALRGMLDSFSPFGSKFTRAATSGFEG